MWKDIKYNTELNILCYHLFQIDICMILNWYNIYIWIKIPMQGTYVSCWKPQIFFFLNINYQRCLQNQQTHIVAQAVSQHLPKALSYWVSQKLVTVPVYKMVHVETIRLLHYKIEQNHQCITIDHNLTDKSSDSSICLI